MGSGLSRVNLPGVFDPTVVTAMPTTATRIRERGYNQAGLLAERVAQSKGVRLVNGLARTHASKSQTSLHPSERHSNVQGAFRVLRAAHEAFRGADVLLVDDVLTTGATASAAASELTLAGARQVTILAFARALPKGVHSCL